MSHRRFSPLHCLHHIPTQYTFGVRQFKRTSSSTLFDFIQGVDINGCRRRSGYPETVDFYCTGVHGPPCTVLRYMYRCMKYIALQVNCTHFIYCTGPPLYSTQEYVQLYIELQFALRSTLKTVKIVLYTNESFCFCSYIGNSKII